jgi:cell division initiation protein
MTLSPADIERKTFSTALRGYDLDEVDEFLDEIVATITELEHQLEEARARPQPAPSLVVEPEAPPMVAEAEPRVVAPTADEAAVGRALIAAQAAADQILADARVEAGSIVEEAKSEAETWTSERDVKKAEAEAEMAELTQRVAAIRRELAMLATAVADRLDEMDAAISGDTAQTLTATMEDEPAEGDEALGFETDLSQAADSVDADEGSGLVGGAHVWEGDSDLSDETEAEDETSDDVEEDSQAGEEDE